MVTLEIYVVDDCWSCVESRRIAAAAQIRFAGHVEVVLRDLERDPHPPNVFAAPTYVLEGRIISLGNPRRELLWAQLEEYAATDVAQGETEE